MLSNEEKNIQWKKLIEQYISLHKYLKEVGKKWISEGKAGVISADTQKKLSEALTQIDKALLQLKDFFKPHFTNIDTTDMFTEDKFKSEIQNLSEENSMLKEDNKQLRQINEEYQMYAHNTDVKKLEMERQSLIIDKQSLELKVMELEEICKMLVQKVEMLSSGKNHQGEESSQTIHRRKQNQFDETLKAQNDLIEDLKQQLINSNRDREILKMLNRNLESELLKKNDLSQDRELENILEDKSSSQFTYSRDNNQDKDDGEREKFKKYLSDGTEDDLFKPENYTEEYDNVKNAADATLKGVEDIHLYQYSDLQQQLHELKLQSAAQSQQNDEIVQDKPESQSQSQQAVEIA